MKNIMYDKIMFLIIFLTVFDQINATLVSIRDIFSKTIIQSLVVKARLMQGFVGVKE